jgi:hypothetical protein
MEEEIRNSSFPDMWNHSYWNSVEFLSLPDDNISEQIGMEEGKEEKIYVTFRKYERRPT